MEREREREGEGRVLYIDSYVTLRYVTLPFLSSGRLWIRRRLEFEVSTKESRKKRERELQIASQLPRYIYTLPDPT